MSLQRQPHDVRLKGARCKTNRPVLTIPDHACINKSTERFRFGETVFVCISGMWGSLGGVGRVDHGSNLGWQRRNASALALAIELRRTPRTSACFSGRDLFLPEVLFICRAVRARLQPNAAKFPPGGQDVSDGIRRGKLPSHHFADRAPNAIAALRKMIAIRPGNAEPAAPVTGTVPARHFRTRPVFLARATISRGIAERLRVAP